MAQFTVERRARRAPRAWTPAIASPRVRIAARSTLHLPAISARDASLAPSGGDHA